MKSRVVQNRRLRVAMAIARSLDAIDLFVDYDGAEASAAGAEDGLLLNLRRGGRLLGSFRLAGGLKSEPFAIHHATGVMASDEHLRERVLAILAGFEL